MNRTMIEYDEDGYEDEELFIYNTTTLFGQYYGELGIMFFYRNDGLKRCFVESYPNDDADSPSSAIFQFEYSEEEYEKLKKHFPPDYKEFDFDDDLLLELLIGE